MRFSMLYSGEQILSFKSCLVFYAGDSLNRDFCMQKLLAREVTSFPKKKKSFILY